MDLFTELLKPSNNFKTESTTKDRKQNKQSKYPKSVQTRQSSPATNRENTVIRKASNWDEVERRSGKDRREQMEGRGRWLESRAEKDRRQIAKAIQFKI
ncbi:hypothetical protein Q4493_08215 [Colwellia sp. 1_MG-2023]|uniref:hypothetical protein n=1 Tax=Colwellia sp. 1_MG-2023 TaxID=3062649 RepID=UPI0026E348E5|nr:hypothetical protein [Colwellia sp. 1_MG-2023]MDO6445754.1 hypothetical protein [Colwellia sp. 1_MG-2023]